MIFVGIVTCNRPLFFNKCYERIKKCEDIDFIAIVNDGTDNIDVDKKDQYIKNVKNLGVGASKNELFKAALKQPQVKHIFIIEDDIIVKDKNVFKNYINASKKTGIQHFMFGYHGPANKGNVSGGTPSPRYIIEYNDVKIAINMHSVGAFCYYSREVLDRVGLIDEKFLNAFDHVDHDYRISKAGYCTPYWNWPDLANSYELLDEIECSENSSTIRPRKDWQDNIKKGAEYFYSKHGVMPAWQNCIPDTSKPELLKIMKQIYNNYAKRD